jgi:aerobic carbon-monoxide dehydrogenase medium subunit
MLLESVEYTRPATVQEALEALRSREGAAPLAGGQSLVNVLKNRVASVELLVDISGLEELRSIATDNGAIEVGACVTYDEIDGSPEIREAHPILSRVAAHIEDQQIRNRGTIGGNCCLSDPTNNLPPLLIALDATMNVQSSSGIREVPADEFFKGYFMTAVERGEILRSISIPALTPNSGVGYNTLNVASDSKAIVRAAAMVQANGEIVDARVVLAVVGPVPIRHRPMEDALRGSPATADSAREAAETIGDDLEPIGDIHGSAEYRRQMARVVAHRAAAEAIARGGQGQ